MKCINCGREFEAKRSDAKYCGAYCRVTANRIKGEIPVTKEEISVTTVTANELLQVKPVTDNVTDKEPIKSDIPGVKSDTIPDRFKSGFILSAEQLDSLPTGVTKPYSPDAPAWAHTEDYMKTIHRLVTWKLDRLEAEHHWIPAWRGSRQVWC